MAKGWGGENKKPARFLVSDDNGSCDHLKSNDSGALLDVRSIWQFKARMKSLEVKTMQQFHFFEILPYCFAPLPRLWTGMNLTLYTSIYTC